MQPSQADIDQVATAFVDIVTPLYTPEQQSFLNDFLQNGAKTYRIDVAQPLFSDKPEVAKAIEALNQFSNKYEKEQAIMAEFLDELEELLIQLNHEEGGISI